ncbi:DUF4349 domain-containing protein [Terricaulis sp.]|uniref:DUF4349 domain-containing protein n=1 Tax=Terricaulis sp. TaxID=2768686 RepID=UPI002AC6B523|nr:DUF4349 domain-containing protein [Terricaulis sp.]MDZ4689974.1 DUF4349 domain-containing protein [Terricaulis sp.]
MLRFVAGTILVLALAACGQANNAAPTEETSAAYGGMQDMDRAQSAGEAAPAAPPPPGAATPTPTPPQQGGGTVSPVLYLAYSYGLGLEIPSQRLSAVMDAHVTACQSAGPRLCQLIGSNRSGDPDSQMSGYVQLRAEPQWLRTFMEGMAAEVDEAGGRINSRTTGSEDLTRQIVDTEARIRALSALRDRLQELLRSRPGRLADLLEVERELARVQGELDAIQSNLAVMRTRVSMSELNIQYQSAPRPLGSDTMEPLRQAFADFLGVIVGGFAAILYIIAGLIPILVVVAPLIWLALRWRKRRGGRFFGAARTPRAAEENPPS